jgi:hypothetical protein
VGYQGHQRRLAMCAVELAGTGGMLVCCCWHCSRGIQSLELRLQIKARGSTGEDMAVQGDDMAVQGEDMAVQGEPWEVQVPLLKPSGWQHNTALHCAVSRCSVPRQHCHLVLLVDHPGGSVSAISPSWSGTFSRAACAWCLDQECGVFGLFRFEAVGLTLRRFNVSTDAGNTDLSEVWQVGPC